MYRKNTFIALMENYGDVIKNTEAAINSEGVAMQKQEIFANSLQASINNLKSTWEELYLTSINSDFIKGFMQSANGLLSFFTNMSKSIGTLPVILLSVVTALNLFGKFNFSKSILTSVQNFRVQLALLKMEQTALSTQQSGLVVSSSKLGIMFQALTGKTIAQTLASVGLTVATTALNVALTFGLSMAITGIITAISSYVNRTKEAREEQQKFIADTKQHVQSLNEEVSQSKEYLKTLESSSSTTDQLVEARKALSELFPSIIIGYDNEGKAILANNESIKEQIALKEKQIEIEKKRLREASGYDILQNISEKKQSQDQLQRLASKKVNLNNQLSDSSNLSPLEQEQAKQNPAIYKRRNEEIQQSIADIASEEAKLAQKIQESNDKLRSSYVSLMPDMTKFSEAQKKIAENYIATAIEGEYTQEKFIQGLQYTLNNEKLLQATEQELANQKKKTNNSNTKQSKSFEELSKQVKDTVTEVKELNDIQSDLAKNNTLSADSLIDLINKYPELLDYITKTKNGYIVEAQGINIVKQALVDKQIVALETESGISNIIKTELAGRLESYGIEIEAIDTLNQARESAYKLFGGDTKGKTQISMYDAQDLAKTKEQLESIAKINALKDMLKSGLTIPEVNTPDKDKTPPIKQPADAPAKLEIVDRYYELNQQLEKTNSLIQKNEVLQKSATYSKKIELLKEEITLYKQKQDNLHAIAEETRKESKDIQNNPLLKKLGFKFETKDGEVSLANYSKNIKNLYDKLNKHRSDKDKTYYNSLKENIDDAENLITRFFNIQSKELPDLSKQWFEVSGSIADINNAIKDTAKDQIKTVEDTQDKISDLIKKYYDKQKTIAEKAHDDEEKRLEKASKDYKKYIDDNIKQLDRKKEAEDYNTDVEDKLKEINELQSKINSLTSAAMSGDTEAQSKIEDYKKELDEKNTDILKTQRDRDYDVQKQAYQDDADLYDEFIDKQKTKNDEKLQNYKDAIDKELSDAKLKIETTNGLLLENVSVVTQGLNGEIKTLTLSLQDLFTETGENATNSSRLIEGEFLTSLTKVRDMYQEISTLYNIASGGNIKIPEVKTSGTTGTNNTSMLVNLAEKLLPMASTMLPSPNIISPYSNISPLSSPQLSIGTLVNIEGNADANTVNDLKQESNTILNRVYGLLKSQGRG